MAQTRTLAAVAILGLGLAAVAALAGGSIPVDPPEVLSPSVLFLDEFEDGGLTVDDVPPGKWDGLVDRPGTDAGVSALAAHAGNRGLRITDGTNLPATGTTISPYVSLGPGDGDRYLRAWVRIPDTNDSGVTTIMQFLHGPRSVMDVMVSDPSGNIQLAAETADGGYLVTPTGYTMVSDWRLLEVGLIDAGTEDVTQVLWVGTARAGQHRVNQAGWTVDELDIGEPWADDGRFQGTIDFDGVAVTVDPPPSHVDAVSALDGGFDGGMVAGQCYPFYAQLMSSSGTPAGSLRSDTLYLIVDGGSASAATFTDPSCNVAGSFVDIDAGTAEVGFGLIGLTTGSFLVSVGTTDLYADLLFGTVLSADGGTFDGGTDGGFDAGFDADAGSDGGVPQNDAGQTGTTDGGGTTGGDGGSGNLVTDGGTDGGETGGDGGSNADGGEQPPPGQMEVCGCGAGGGPWSGAGLIALWALALARRRRQAVFCSGGAAAEAAASARYVR